ncbi:hypothetical protein C8J56DRAFT_815078 [Mycena floridula]|nr:hypothetical protein C8J56DRAFT_815078 [Mycena floridula]
MEKLPVELLYEIQLMALSDALPRVSQRLYDVFHASSPLFRAQYILRRVSPSNIYGSALRYPICSKETLTVLHRKCGPTWNHDPDLPRRLFRHLRKSNEWTNDDHPLPFLRHLYSLPGIKPHVDSYDGYALTRAVNAEFIPLIQFLLEHGASPKLNDAASVLVAIHQHNLALVKMLVEPNEKRGAKRCKLEDRVELTPKMLKIAVKCDAQDIAIYLRAKGCIPDMETLRLLNREKV